MYLVEKVAAPNEQRLAMIYMRYDGLFEGRIYHPPAGVACYDSEQWGETFEVCAITETLARARTIVYEELGL
jgi:hypothetical protein